MTLILEQFIESNVFVISFDGRVFVGVLKGFDQATNLVLYDCQERVYHPEAPVEELELGVYVLRGENVVLVGEVDLDVDRSITGIAAHPLKPVVH